MKTWYLLIAAESLIFFIAFAVHQCRLRRFLRAMNHLREKNPSGAILAKNTGGMKSMWAGLKEISQMVERLEYEKRQGVLEYSRFAPLGFEALFGKDRLGEVEQDSLRETRGVLVKFSTDSFQKFSGRNYRQMVGRGLEVISQNLQKHQGILVSCDPDCLCGKCFFQGQAWQAARFAVDAAADFRNGNFHKDMNRIFILHRTDYYCGMAGFAERALPFLYSNDDELLGLYEDDLKKAGLWVVMTDAVLNALPKHSYPSRYIGYLSDKRQDRKLKLYENLEAYSEERCRRITNALPTFEKALDLFYSNDFYLARSAFNDVLQENPFDSVARWYLFNCEYYLNTDGAQISYGLYENRMLKRQYHD